MSDSVRPHRWQPNRLPCPWDSPGKNTRVGCYFLLQCMKVKSEVKSLSRVRLLATPWTAAHQAPPSMGFSRQEYWSGVPLPSPRSLLVICFMHVYVSHSAMSDSLPPYELSPARLLSPWNSPGKNTEVGTLQDFMCFICQYMSVQISQFISPPFPI